MDLELVRHIIHLKQNRIGFHVLKNNLYCGIWIIFQTRLIFSIQAVSRYPKAYSLVSCDNALALKCRIMSSVIRFGKQYGTSYSPFRFPQVSMTENISTAEYHFSFFVQGSCSAFDGKLLAIVLMAWGFSFYPNVTICQPSPKNFLKIQSRHFEI